MVSYVLYLDRPCTIFTSSHTRTYHIFMVRSVMYTRLWSGVQTLDTICSYIQVKTYPVVNFSTFYPFPPYSLDLNKLKIYSGNMNIKYSYIKKCFLFFLNPKARLYGRDMWKTNFQLQYIFFTKIHIKKLFLELFFNISIYFYRSKTPKNIQML